MARDKHGNDQEDLEVFARLVREGGKILCHPLQYFAILEAAKSWSLEFDIKEKLRPDVTVERNKVIAVRQTFCQTIQFK